MSLINGSQIRAARGLLNWSQDDLADFSNVSRKTIRLIEGDIPARTSTIRKLQDTFIEHGVEFTHGHGLRVKSKDFFDFTGSDSCEEFFEHMGKTISDRGGDVICMIPEMEMLTKPSGARARSNLQRLEDIQKIATVKCLMDDGITLDFTRPSFEIRQLHDEPTVIPISVFAYGNQLACGFQDDNKVNFTFAVFNKASFMLNCQNYFLPRWEIARSMPEPKKLRKLRA